MKKLVPKNILKNVLQTWKEHLPDDKILKKQTRGSTSFTVSEDGQMACTKWLDNKPVVMLSTNERAR